MSAKISLTTDSTVELAGSQEKRGLIKSIRWWDGFVLGLAVPGFLFPSLGVSVAELGAVVAIIVWLISVLMGALQSNIYAEMSAMFPTKSGGIGVYGNEGIQRYSKTAGMLAIWGYWFGWSVTLSINGMLIGDYLQAELFPHADPYLTPRIIGTVMLVGLWAFNVLGLRPGVWLAYVLGALTVAPLLIVMIVPFVNGTFHPANLLPLTAPDHTPWLSAHGIQRIVYWLFAAGWSTYGIEIVATFAPEYKHTTSDTPRALRSTAIFNVAVYALVPLGLVGVLGQQGIQANVYTAFDPALKSILGAAPGTLIIILVIASLILSANVSTMDGSRALWQMSRDHMTVKALGHLNRHGVPDIAMTLDLLAQVALMWIFGSPIIILAASNLGYFLCHIVVLTAFVLLRRDQPKAARPFRLRSGWVGVAIALAALNLVFLAVGIWAPEYGGLTAPLAGVGVLLVGLAFYAFRRLVEDRRGQRTQNQSSNPKLIE